MNLPGWDSIEATTRLHGIFEISGIVILGLLVLAEVIAYQYGQRKEKLIAAKEQEKEERHRTEVATLQTQLNQAKQARTIAPEKRAALLACLKDQGGGPVYVRPARLDAEATAYGKEIEDLLREAGFEIREWPDPSMSWSRPGAFLIVRDLNHAPKSAVSIQSCFESVGIVLEGYAKAEHPADAVSIAIGSR